MFVFLVRVPWPLLPQSAKLTGAKGAMELTCLPRIDIGGMPGRHYQWVTDYSSVDKLSWPFSQSVGVGVQFWAYDLRTGRTAKE